MEFGEAFRAIAALEQESTAIGDLGQLGGQRARLARKDERGIPAQFALRRGKRLGIGIMRKLPCFVAAPAFRSPVRRHFRSTSPRAFADEGRNGKDKPALGG